MKSVVIIKNCRCLLCNLQLDSECSDLGLYKSYVFLIIWILNYTNMYALRVFDSQRRILQTKIGNSII